MNVPPTKENGMDARQRSHQRTLDMLQACEAERDALREALERIAQQCSWASHGEADYGSTLATIERITDEALKEAGSE